MNDREPPLIEHDRDEPSKDTSRSPWGVLAVILLLGWAGSLTLFELDWHSIALGGFTGLVLTAWGLEITGNRVPRSWRGKAPGPRA